MRLIFHMLTAAMMCSWASIATAVPITAEFGLDIRDCVIFDTGVPYIFAGDCTGTITIETDTEITFDTPDIGQTGSAVLNISSPTYGTTSALFFNYLEEYIFDIDGTLIPICLSYCFYSDYDADDGLSFGWGAYRGVPYSSGQFSNGSGHFDYEDMFRNSGGTSFGMVANGDIIPASVPLPSSALMLLLGCFGLLKVRRRRG